MKRFVFAALGGLVCASTISCQRADGPTQKKLDDILSRVKAIETHLARGAEGKRQARRRPQPKRPDPKTVYAVPVSPSDPFRGGEHAKVTMVEAYEFACPYCAMVQPAIQTLLEDYDDNELKVVSKQLVVHADLATNAALAACAANLQGEFAAYEKAIWESAWELEPRPRLRRENLTAEALEKLAKKIGLDITRFKRDMTGSACKQAIARSRAELARLGVNWTPQIYINGRPYQGPRTAEAFKRVIDAEIAKADTALKRGATLAGYYQSLTTNGKKSL